MTALIVGKALAPFGMALLAWGIAAPVRKGVERWAPEGPVKRFLLRKIN